MGNIMEYRNPNTDTIAENFQLINGKGISSGARIEYLRWNRL